MLDGIVIIDAHHHVGRKYQNSEEWEFTPEDLLRNMDKNGVKLSVILHFISALHTNIRIIEANDYVADAVIKYPHRFAGAMIINPTLGDSALREVERGKSIGLKAVKLHPHFHGYYPINGGVADEVIQLASEMSLPILIHSDFTTSVSSPYEIVSLAARFPNTTFVLLHFGLHPEYCRRVPGIVHDYPNVILDTSQTPDFPNEIYVRSSSILGAERIIFGSDGPECDQSVNLKKVEVAHTDFGLTREDAVKILGENAHRIFKLED